MVDPILYKLSQSVISKWQTACPVYIEMCMASHPWATYNGNDFMSFNAIPAQSLKARILVVDDHELMRHKMVSLLARNWEICGEAGNGTEAIRKVHDLTPDLVLLDIYMPVMSAVEAARAIRAIAPNTKIVLVSVDDSPKVGELMKASGADGFVSKSCRPEVFQQTIAAILHLRPA
jgi:CheY-like chemotaxis protein